MITGWNGAWKNWLKNCSKEIRLMVFPLSLGIHVNGNGTGIHRQQRTPKTPSCLYCQGDHCDTAAGVRGSWSKFLPKSPLLQAQVTTCLAPSHHSIKDLRHHCVGILGHRLWEEFHIQRTNWKLNLKPACHKSHQMITINGVQKQSLSKFDVRLGSLDDRMSEQVEITRCQETEC